MSTMTPITKPSDEVQQLLKILIDNNLINKFPSTSGAEEVYIAISQYDSKRGRDLYDKASFGLPASERYNLKQPGALCYLKLLRRTSDCYFWGSVLNAIKTDERPFSLLWDYQKISMDDMVKEA